MGVWDMLYLMQRYKKALALSENPGFSEATRAELIVKAEHIRAQMARYMERVENEIEVKKLLEEKK